MGKTKKYDKTEDGSIRPTAVAPEKEKGEIAELLNLGVPGEESENSFDDIADVEEEDQEPYEGEDLSFEEEKEEDVEEEEEFEDDSEEESEEEEKETEEDEEEEDDEEEYDEEKDPLFKEVRRLSKLLAVDDEQSFIDTKEGKFEKQEEGKEEEKEEKKEEKKEDRSIEDLFKEMITEQEIKPVDFVSEKDFEGVFDDVEQEKFNVILNKVVKETSKVARKQALSDAMRVIPNIMENKIKGHIAAERFWTQNQDISFVCSEYPEFRKYVARVSSQIERENPDWTFDKIFNKTAENVRSILGEERIDKMKAKHDKKKSVKKKKPSFAKKSSSSKKSKRKRKPNISGEQKEILELINNKR